MCGISRLALERRGAVQRTQANIRGSSHIDTDLIHRVDCTPGGILIIYTDNIHCLAVDFTNSNLERKISTRLMLKFDVRIMKNLKSFSYSLNISNLLLSLCMYQVNTSASPHTGFTFARCEELDRASTSSGISPSTS